MTGCSARWRNGRREHLFASAGVLAAVCLVTSPAPAAAHVAAPAAEASGGDEAGKNEPSGKKSSGKKSSGKKSSGKKSSGKKSGGKKSSGKKSSGKKSSGKKSGGKKSKQEAPEDPFVVVGEKIREGQERFDIADYEGAVDQWSDAYVGLPDGTDAAAYRATLAYQIATACREAYKVNHDIKYLRKAEHLLEQYIESLGAEEEEARASADEVLSELRGEIEQVERARETERAKSEEGLTQIRDEIREQEREAAEKQAAAAQAEAARNDRARAQKRGQQLQIGGGVALGVGAALLGAMAYGLVRGGGLEDDGATIANNMGVETPQLEEIRDDGVRMNQLAIGAGISGGVLVVVGAALVTVGTLQRREVVALQPALGPGFAGLTWTGRF